MVSHKVSDNKKPAIVLDIGNAFTKAGYAGDDKPICVVESKLTDALEEIWLRDIHEPEKLKTTLRKFLRQIYLRQLLVSMGERAVIVCENLFCPQSWKNIVAHVLLVDFEVPSVIFAPRHLLSLYTLGISTGLVVHSGYSETLVLPIYENMVLINSCQSITAGGQDIEKSLLKQLSETAKIEVNGSLRSMQDSQVVITDKQLEDIKVRTCFITRMDRADALLSTDLSAGDGQVSPSPPDVKYPLGGDAVLHIPGRVRETTCEVLYHPDFWDCNLASAVLDSIKECPIDSRRKLAANIVLIGGNSMLPGFKHRLQQELIRMCQHPLYSESMSIETFAFHKVTKENCVAWLGGAIFGASGRLDQHAVTRDEFEALDRTVPDWSTYIPSDNLQQYDSPV